MSVIDRVKEHFESQGVKKIEVAEWGEEGQPLVIYCSPFTLAEKRNLFKGARNDDLGVLVDAIMLKAKDKDGNKIFKLDDKHSLLNKADPDIIARVSTEMLNSASLEEAEKK
tara:strand:+ start:1061 stop:1396 length:336 start_codon:yes stop_codon:yes gene_type:complete